MTTSTAVVKAETTAVETHAETVKVEVVNDNGLETVNLCEWRSLRDEAAERTVHLIQLWWHNKFGTQAQLSKEMGVTPRTVRRKVQEMRAKGIIPQLPVTDGRKDGQKDRKKEATKASCSVLDDYQNVKRGAELVFSKVTPGRIGKRLQAEIVLLIAAEFMEHAEEKGQDDARDVIEQEMSTYQETIDSIPATKPKQIKPAAPAKPDQESQSKAPEEQGPTPESTLEPEWGSETSEAQEPTLEPTPEPTLEPTPEPTAAPESKGTADQKPAEESDTATESDEAPKGPEPGEGLNPTFEQVAAEANCK